MAVRLGAGPTINKDASVISHPAVKDRLIERAKSAIYPINLKL